MSYAEGVARLEAAMRLGRERSDGRDGRIAFRFLTDADDFDAITKMLHRAYAPLAQSGLRFLASHQPSEVTRKRTARGDTILAVADHTVIGTITLARASNTQGSPFYDRADVASFGQFAVDPTFQRTGVGSRLLELVEALAIAQGVREVALDTAEHAAPLVGFYSSRGYRFIEYAQWPTVNYRSMILAKTLTDQNAAV